MSNTAQIVRTSGRASSGIRDEFRSRRCTSPCCQRIDLAELAGKIAQAPAAAPRQRREIDLEIAHQLLDDVAAQPVVVGQGAAPHRGEPTGLDGVAIVDRAAAFCT